MQLLQLTHCKSTSTTLLFDIIYWIFISSVFYFLVKLCLVPTQPPWPQSVISWYSGPATSPSTHSSSSTASGQTSELRKYFFNSKIFNLFIIKFYEVWILLKKMFLDTQSNNFTSLSKTSYEVAGFNWYLCKAFLFLYFSFIFVFIVFFDLNSWWWWQACQDDSLN